MTDRVFFDSIALMTTFAGIIFILLLVVFWFDSARDREIAVGVCQAACKARGLQFLDQTVSLYRIGIRWPNQGIRIRRLFRFEFSEEGVGRRVGHITMLGVNLEEFSLGLPTPDEDEQHQGPALH